MENLDSNTETEFPDLRAIVYATPQAAIASPDSLFPVCSPAFKPCVGMRFANLDAGKKFYDDYGNAAGFKTRSSSCCWSEDKSSIRRKCFVCNKAGFNESRVGDEVKANCKPKRGFSRCGCPAKIVLKLVKDKNVYVLSEFVEGHNHSMYTPVTLCHLKDSRDITLVHKKMIIDNSRVNQGASRSYRMIKEYVNGYKNIGASLQDFKNFMRDVKQYIKDNDAQMLVENFMRKKSMCSSFWFDFDVDKEGRLSRVFWADAVCRKNYMLFGDMVSFDTTFRKNKYCMIFAPFTGVDHHRKCVTFGCGLLANEDEESFTWLFKCFLNCMLCRQPVVIITDQDPAMKLALPAAWDMEKTKHRLCMWHIMKKLSEKVGKEICEQTDFLLEFGVVVWNRTIDTITFEEQWASVIAKYDLEGHGWLAHLLAIRFDWITAYFRDLFLGAILRTTSLSESENNFFGNFTNPNITLLEFLLRYDSAMDSQRWSQVKVIADSKNLMPRTLTPLDLEKHAAEIYTPSVFYLFQTELKFACFSIGVVTLDVVDGGRQFYTLRDPFLEHDIVVEFIEPQKAVFCSCKMFEREGYLCRHALYVIKDRGYRKIPDAYVLRRWCKYAYSRGSTDIDQAILDDCNRIDDTNKKVGALWSEIFSCVSLVEGNEELIDEMPELLCKFKENLKEKGCKLKGGDKTKQIGSLLDATIPAEVVIKPPAVSVTKGSGSGKRIMSYREAASKKQSKKPTRLCHCCNQYTSHDKRTCPQNPYARRNRPATERTSAQVNQDAEGNTSEEEET